MQMYCKSKDKLVTFHRSCVHRVIDTVNFERRGSWAVAFMFQMHWPPPPPPTKRPTGSKTWSIRGGEKKIANIFSLALGNVPAASNGHFANPLCDRLINMGKRVGQY
jgi:hypothetical protein